MEHKTRILVVDDDRIHRQMLSTLLEEWNMEAVSFSNGSAALEYCHKMAGTPEFPELALVDMRMPGLTGQETLEKLHLLAPELPIIMMTAFSDVPDAVLAIRSGAQDYLVKPLDFEKLEQLLKSFLPADENIRKSAPDPGSPNLLMGQSPSMHQLKNLVAKVAPSEANILISGESGTGKELTARAIHAASRRASGPFLAINCGAFTESLLASELFGHEKGAFTGADRKHDGIFMEASGGSLFLDEIGEMPLNMQVKLLRVLQEKEIFSVGAGKPKKIDCRIIAATNRDLKAEIAKGAFREDLFYRLNVVSVTVPPLRERKEDIPLLANNFARKFAEQNNKTFNGISPEAMAILRSWPWPGNVRELENVMERALILMTGERVGIRELPETMLQNESIAKTTAMATETDESFTRQDPSGTAGKTASTLAEVERKIIMETLKQTGNNKTETARLLGITRKTLHAKLNKYSDES